jgi:hypothetical protein
MNSTQVVFNEFYPLFIRVAQAFPPIFNKFYYNSLENKR